jgi:hypothetical protein
MFVDYLLDMTGANCHKGTIQTDVEVERLQKNRENGDGKVKRFLRNSNESTGLPK